MAGLLDDIIQKVNSMKEVPLQWEEEEAEEYPPQVEEEYYQVAPLQMQEEAEIIEEVPQEIVQQPIMEQCQEQIQTYHEEIQNLYVSILNLSVPEMEIAFQELVSVTEAIGNELEELESMEPAVELEPQVVSNQELMQEPSHMQPLASSLEDEPIEQEIMVKRIQNKTQQRLKKFPTEAAIERWTDALLGQVCTKVERITLDQEEKFVWLDKNVKKLFWSNSEGEPACGSFSLANMEFILIGKPSIDFSKGLLNYKQIAESSNTELVPEAPSISFVNDRREVNLIMKDVQQCDILAAAVMELDNHLIVKF